LSIIHDAVSGCFLTCRVFGETPDFCGKLN
jgi:hypothetical protein